MERKIKKLSSSRREHLRGPTKSTRLKDGSLKTSKKKKSMKAAKQKTKLDKKQIIEAISAVVVTQKRATGENPVGLLNGQQKLDQHKKKKKKKKVAINNEQHGSNSLEVATSSFVPLQHVFASNYQQLVQQAMEVTSKGCDNEDAIPVVSQISFENNYRHLVSSALCLGKKEGNHNKNSKMPIQRESIASMFRHGFSNADVSATPNDRSHIPQFADIGANRSVADFTRCGRSGALQPADESDEDKSDEDVPTLLNPVDHESRFPFYKSIKVTKEKVSVVPPISFHRVPNNKYIVVMKHPATLFFQGQVQTRVVAGALQVLGHTLNSECSEYYLISSPAGYSMLGLKTVDTNNNITNRKSIQAKLVAFGLDSTLASDVTRGLNVPYCVLVIQKANSPFATYLASHCSIHLYPTNTLSTRPFFEAEKKLQCTFEYDIESVSKCHQEPFEWSQLANSTAESIQTGGPTRVMICGGKSVGKSTLLRFLINQSLAITEEVLCLDFDPGQSEFTVPGSVSVVRVSTPLLGPSFTHLLDAERMVYIGNLDISQCPERYIKSAKHIIDFCLSHPKLNQMPWFINTMGFSKGIGVVLTSKLICLVNPSKVVQIQSKSSKRNFPTLLSCDYISSQRNVLLQPVALNESHLDYSLHIIPSAAEEKQPGPVVDWGLPPKKVRNIMVLAYFYEMLEAPRFSLTDIIPRKIPFSKLKLGICHESVNYNHLLNVINANIVALCIATDDENCLQADGHSELPLVLVQPPISPCLGFGVVRGFDERALYLISPLRKEQLEKVNCLLAGSLTLPVSYYTNKTSGLGHMPYVNISSGQATSNRITRKFVPAAAQRNQRKH